MKYLQTLSVATAFISALSLYYGSLGIPPNIQSWDGETARELAIQKRDIVLKWIGVPSAFIAAINQIFLIWWPVN
jgi:hypothetical protein